MEHLTRLIDRHSNFIKFCIVGGLNTVISLIVFKLLLDQEIHYSIASVGGYFVGILNGYVLSSKFVFNKSLSRKRSGRFLLVYISALGINLFNMFVLVDLLKIHPMLSQAIAICVNIMYNYTLNKFWAFK